MKSDKSLSELRMEKSFNLSWSCLWMPLFADLNFLRLSEVASVDIVALTGYPIKVDWK